MNGTYYKERKAGFYDNTPRGRYIPLCAAFDYRQGRETCHADYPVPKQHGVVYGHVVPFYLVKPSEPWESKYRKRP